MKPKNLYLALCALGIVLPYWQFIPWAASHGLNLDLMIRELFANSISAFFGVDVLVSSLVLLVCIGVEASRSRIAGCWLPVLALVSVGVSLALPLFLYLRELSLERETSQEAAS